MLTRSLTILTAFAALALMGCGSPDAPGAALDVRSSLVEGEVSGVSLTEARIGPLSGFQSGLQLGFRSADGPHTLSVDLCDPEQTIVEDPYGTIGGGRPFPGGPCFDQVTFCDEVTGCMGMGDIEIESIALPDGELLVIDATDGGNSTVHVEIEYGEL